jgi:hypothetical protein
MIARLRYMPARCRLITALAISHTQTDMGRQAAYQACLVRQDQTLVGDPAPQLGDRLVVAFVELLAESSRARRTGLGDGPAGQLAHDPQNTGNPQQSSVIDVVQHDLQVRVQPQHVDDEVVDQDRLRSKRL